MPDAPLTGDQIAAALAVLNLDDDTRNTALDALISAQVTAEQMQVVIDVGGAYAGDDDYAVPAAWRALAEMVATGMDADTIRQWRAIGVPDTDTEALRHSVPVQTVAECAEADPYLPAVLGMYLPLLWQADVPGDELGMWARAGFLTADAASYEHVVNTIAAWRAELGPRAAVYAYAGFSLDEAVACDRQGRFDRAGLEVLGALAAHH